MSTARPPPPCPGSRRSSPGRSTTTRCSCWAYPGDHRRAEALPGVFSVYAGALRRHEETYVAQGFGGVALWVPPGKPAIADDEAGEFARRIAEAAGPEADRLFEVMELIEAHHPQSPSWFLHLLGVEPERQGRGYGGTLLTKMLERLDRDGAAASLDATSVERACASTSATDSR